MRKNFAGWLLDQTDPHVGRLTYLRIYSGKLEAGQGLYNASG